MTAVAAWFVYANVVSGLLCLAGLAGESALRSSGRPGRWAWAGAMLLSIGLPLAAWAGWHPGSSSVVPDMTLIPLPPLVVEAGAGGAAAGPSDNDVMIGLWVLGSAAVLFFLWVSWLSLNRERRQWRPDMLGGVRVMVARQAGPAAAGVRYPDIVVPEWALKLETRVRRLMLLHEGEHVRAGDTRVAAMGLLLLAVVPWNLPLWWQFRRLRQAVELDCDERVLRRTQDGGRYGALLIEVGRRRSLPMLGLALAEPASFLERRIRRIAFRPQISGLHRVLALTAMTVMLSGAAVFTRDPMVLAEANPVSLATRPTPAEVVKVVLLDEEEEREPAVDPRVALSTPAFTPMTKPPQILNKDEVERALQRNYPPVLWRLGVGAEVHIWFFVDTLGVAQQTLINRSSGYKAVDDAALRVAKTMRFSPAWNQDRLTDVWISLPIRFEARAFRPPANPRVAPVQSRVDLELEQANNALRITQQQHEALLSRSQTLESAVREAANLGNAILMRQLQEETRRVRQQAEEARRQIAERQEEVAEVARQANASAAVPDMTAPPRILNEAEVAAALRREMQWSGASRGEVTLWFYVDEQGKVAETILDRSSGNPAVDHAAMRVARTIRFSPARSGLQPVAVWISLPIRFVER